MRWERLFADLEAQFDEQERAERHVEAAERTRAEVGRVRLAERLRAALGHRLVLTLAGLPAMRCVLDRVGPDWLLVTDERGIEHVVMYHAVRTIGALPAAVAAPGTPAAERIRAGLTVRSALRGLARDRSPVQIRLLHAPPVIGTIDRVGADFVDVAAHETGELRRAPRSTQTVPFSAMTSVSRRN